MAPAVGLAAGALRRAVGSGGLTLTLVAAWLCGCGSGPPPRVARPAPVLPPLPALPLLVPAGADAVLVAHPRALWAAPASHRVVAALLPPHFLRTFRDRTGVDPSTVDEAVMAEYPQGFVLLARLAVPAPEVVRAAGHRMDQLEARENAPFVRRLGWFGTDHRDIVALGDHVLVIGGDAGPEMASLLARAQLGRWAGAAEQPSTGSRSGPAPGASSGRARGAGIGQSGNRAPSGSGRDGGPNGPNAAGRSVPPAAVDPPDASGPALVGPDVQALRETLGHAPLVVWAPEPLALPPGYGTSELLRQERALGATLVPAGQNALHVTIALRGAFPNGAVDNFRQLVHSVAQSPLGGALGLRDALDSLRVQVDDRAAVVRLTIPAASLAEGLRVLFVAQLGELLDGPGRGTPAQP